MTTKHNSASGTLRVLAALLSYPDASLRKALPSMNKVLRDEHALSEPHLVALQDLIASHIQCDWLDLESNYVDIFDRGRSTSLHLFEHVFGDSRDRGPAMVDLARTYEQAGLYLAEGELPDYLPVVLEYASTQPHTEAIAFLREMAHLLNAMLAALRGRHTNYACVMSALLEMTGEKLEPVSVKTDEPLDETWAEPAVFQGCTSEGQTKPGNPKPIHLVRIRSTLEPGAPT